MQEIWKSIPNYEGKYEVSNLGHVRSYKQDRKNPRLLKPHYQGGYPRINLYKKCELKHYFVHVLVAQTFIPNPDNKPEINHIDGDKTNNTVANLEWVTPSENINHALQHNLRPQKTSKDTTPRMVFQLPLDCSYLKLWDSISQAAKIMNYNPSGIHRCCSGKRKTYKGCKWEYLEDN